MAQPGSVNTTKYNVINVLYNHNDFSIAIGIWRPTNVVRLAMRWNDAADGNGYPKTFGHPQWFIISEDIAKNLLYGLLGNGLLTTQEYNLILSELPKL